MYGTEWCSHCKAQKELFGKSFRYIDYVDCDLKEDVCTLANITGYPTWKINSRSYPGVQSFDVLSRLTNCKYN
ncbi:MAG: glutaredoxin family protein [Candidatus Woesearchaeota archaeon]